MCQERGTARHGRAGQRVGREGGKGDTVKQQPLSDMTAACHKTTDQLMPLPLLQYRRLSAPPRPTPYTPPPHTHPKSSTKAGSLTTLMRCARGLLYFWYVLNSAMPSVAPRNSPAAMVTPLPGAPVWEDRTGRGAGSRSVSVTQ